MTDKCLRCGTVVEDEDCIAISFHIDCGDRPGFETPFFPYCAACDRVARGALAEEILDD